MSPTEAVVKQFRGERQPFIGIHDVWPELLEHFRNVPEIVQAIDERLTRGDLDSRDLYFAALIGRTPLAREELLKKLNDSFRHWPAHALLEGWGMDDPEVAAKLLDIVTESNDSASSIGFLIPQILPDAVLARQRLITLLQDLSCKRTDFVLNGLAQIGLGENGQDILDAAFLHLNAKPNSEHNGANHVFDLFPQEPRVLDYALKLLDDGDGWVGPISYYLRHDATIRQRLRNWSMPLDPNSRSLIASKLRQRLGEPNEVLHLLGAFKTETDSETRVQCAISLAHRTRIERRELEQVVELFIQQVKTTGIAHNSAMQAGISGLLTLRAFNALDSEVDDLRLSKWLPYLIGPYSDTPGNFMTTLVQHWEQIRDVVRSPQTESQDGGFARASIFEGLAPYADGSLQLSQDVLEEIQRNQAFSQSRAALLFLGRVNPRSGLLLEACLKAIGPDNHRRDTALVAAQLLGKHFGGNTHVLERLVPMLGDLPYEEGALIALIEGWPDNPAVKEAFDWFVANQAGASYSLYFRLTGLFSTPEKLTGSIAALFKQWAVEPGIGAESIIPPLVRRLRQDPAFGTALTNWVLEDRHPSAIASVPRLLARAGVLSDELQAWCALEIERLNEKGVIAPVGIDLLAGHVRPIMHSLLDII